MQKSRDRKVHVTYYEAMVKEWINNNGKGMDK